MAKDLVVVIATIGRSELLKRTLSSLEACQKPDIFRGVIVVENGGKGGGENVVYSYSHSLNARYMYLTKACQSRAKNTAVKAVAQEVNQNCLVVFTDDDVRIHAHTLCAYAEASAASDGGKIYGGPVGVDYEVEPPEWLKAYLPASASGWRIEGGLQSHNKADFLGCNWASFVSDLQNAGGFDENFGFGGIAGGTGEETNMQDRLLKRGVKGIYLPDAMVWHYVPAERCSPVWAIKRAYLHGIEAGLRDPRKEQTVLGVSRGMVLAWIKIGLEVLKKSLSGDKKTAFDAYHRFSRFCGYIRGRQLAWKNSANPSQKGIGA